MLAELHQLIQSLTDIEGKRVDAFFSLKEGNDSFLYKDLYSALKDMGETYDKNLLKATATKHNSNLDRLRAYSYKVCDKIMYVLRDPDLRDDICWKIRCLQKDALVLKYKNLPHQAENRLKKALDYAKENKLYDLEASVRQQICQNLFTDGFTNRKQILEHLKAIRVCNERQHVSAKVSLDQYCWFLHLKIHPLNPEDLIDLSEFDPDEAAPENLSFHATLHYFLIQSLRADKNQQSERTLFWQEKALKVFHDSPRYQTYFPWDYLVTIANLLNALLLNKNLEKSQEVIQYLNSLIVRDPHLMAFRARLLILLQLNYWINNPDDINDIPKEDIEDLLGEFDKFSSSIIPNRKFSVHYSLAMLFLLRKDLARARFWGNNVTNNEVKKKRPEVHLATLILLLFIDYEDVNFRRDAIENRINSLRIKFHRDGQKAYQSKLIRCFRKLSKLAPNERDKEKELLQELKIQLLELAHNSDTNQLFRIDLITWYINQKLKTP